MKAERFARKSGLKKHSGRTVGGVALYDLSADPHSDCPVVALAALTEADPVAPDSFTRSDEALCWAVEMMAHSPLSAAFWRVAAARGWSVGLADLGGNGFHLDAEARRIVLDHFALSPAALGRSLWFRNTLLLAFVRALRDIWHEDRLAPFEDSYAPEDVLMLERVRMADGDAVTVLAAWELRGAGYADVWRHLIGSAEGDMALAFTRFLERDPTAFFDGSALTCAFREWYADSGRVDSCDHETLEMLDGFLLDAPERRSFAAKRLIGAVLEELAVLPDGTRYLAGLGDTILADPFFAGLADEINQTHLFHLMYDMEVTVVNNVPFRDRTLARKLFPQNGSLL